MRAGTDMAAMTVTRRSGAAGMRAGARAACGRVAFASGRMLVDLRGGLPSMAVAEPVSAPASCFGSGAWLDNLPWLDDDAWPNK